MLTCPTHVFLDALCARGKPGLLSGLLPTSYVWAKVVRYCLFIVTEKVKLNVRDG